MLANSATISVALCFLMGSTAIAQNLFETEGIKNKNCHVITPLKEIKGARIYLNKAGSEPDVKGIAQHQRFIAPLRDTVLKLSELADQNSPSAFDLECASRILDQWALADALLEGNPPFTARRDRARFSIGLNIVTLKLKILHGYAPSPYVLSWLQKLNNTVLSEYQKRSYADNLYIWSGVNAATFYLLTNDEKSLQYALRVREKAISKISSDGTIETELRRQKRALLYHHYFLSGLLMLDFVLTNQGFNPTKAELDILDRLLILVQGNMCRWHDIEAKTNFLQEPIPSTNLAVTDQFSSLLRAEAHRCYGREVNVINYPLGGNLANFAKAMHRH